ncbi:PKD domain-containing protein [Micromonospora sp. NPDC047707]|uniref:PKD domain-containing protein n=1 Tax=unclassified Micromonospora TaxID=2617518 RepID=UPI0012B450C7|nr:PKD domain-containing protein [Micromonospora sp. WMMC415]QGN46001.1 PKD domain-containing protein [Micromonospora sp. WMMC415]
MLPSSTIYGWNGTRMTLAAFRTASGQAAHDRESDNNVDKRDSANSAAPGYQTTDEWGVARVDDWAVPNTGASPTSYADRGATELVRYPSAQLRAVLNLAADSVQLDASASQPGSALIASYRFTFGDGTTVTQTSPRITHRYAKPGNYHVAVDVIGTDNRSTSAGRDVSVLRRLATVGLLAVGNQRYVGRDPKSGGPLGPNRTTLDSTAEFDVADAGNGQVALFSRADQGYLTTDATGSAALTPGLPTVTTPQRFTMQQNSDGTVSLKSAANGRYVSTNASGSLIPSATAVGPATKFYRANVADANKSLRQAIVRRFVTADPAGTKPLIANSTTAGSNERFDLVDLGGGRVALFAHANRRFVVADAAGTRPLIARTTAVGSDLRGGRRFLVSGQRSRIAVTP